MQRSKWTPLPADVRRVPGQRGAGPGGHGSRRRKPAPCHPLPCGGDSPTPQHPAPPLSSMPLSAPGHPTPCIRHSHPNAHPSPHHTAQAVCEQHLCKRQLPDPTLPVPPPPSPNPPPTPLASKAPSPCYAAKPVLQPTHPSPPHPPHPPPPHTHPDPPSLHTCGSDGGSTQLRTTRKMRLPGGRLPDRNSEPITRADGPAAGCSCGGGWCCCSSAAGLAAVPVPAAPGGVGGRGPLTAAPAASGAGSPQPLLPAIARAAGLPRSRRTARLALPAARPAAGRQAGFAGGGDGAAHGHGASGHVAAVLAWCWCWCPACVGMSP